MTSRLKKTQLSSLSTQGHKKPSDKSIEEQIYEMEIHPIEAERLRKTFLRICGVPPNNDQNPYSNNESNAEGRNSYLCPHSAPRTALTKRTSSPS